MLRAARLSRLPRLPGGAPRLSAAAGVGASARLGALRPAAAARAAASLPDGLDRRESLYEKLGVTPKASLSEIKQAFYQRAKDCHPDLHDSDPDKAAEFRALSDAYDVLSNPDARQKYDASGVDDTENNEDLHKRWKPGDGPSAEEMEGPQRAAGWRGVLRDKEVLRQARAEYMQELRQDLKRACESLLRGDAGPAWHFAKCYPGAVAGGLLVTLPVLLAVRSPHLVLQVLRKLAAVEALTTKVLMGTFLPWLGVMQTDIPDRIWKARVAAARRSIERRKAEEESRSTGSSGPSGGDVHDAQPGSSAAVGEAGAAAASRGFADALATSKAVASEPALRDALVVHAAARSGLPDVSSLVPNVVYLDDSTSLKLRRLVPEGAFSLTSKYRDDTSCLQAGRKELIELAHFLEGAPTRVVKFGGYTEYVEVDRAINHTGWTTVTRMLRTLLLETTRFRNESHLLPLLDAWDGSSEGTYMWKMIETDVMGTYQPGTPIRVHLITDGEDTHSPEPFRGIRGMDALKASLLEQGYRMEWNIILLLFGAHGFRGLTARRYKELCDSSGGVFQLISDGYGNSGADKSLEEFLEAHDTAAARVRLRSHMLAARTRSGDEIELPRITK